MKLWDEIIPDEFVLKSWIVVFFACFNTGDALPIGSTPPPGFDEAIRGGPNNMYPTSSPSRSTYYTQGSTAHSVRSQSTYSSNSSTVTSRQEIETTVRMYRGFFSCVTPCDLVLFGPLGRLLFLFILFSVAPRGRLSQMTVQSKASPGRGGPRHTAAAVAGADGTMGRGSAWTPPLSSNDNTTWTEGTPSYTESSSSEGHTPRRSRNASRESDKRRGLDELDEESPQHVVRVSRV
ncbi:unnamed protein product [Notodromas monacha]|uniref:Uncharacterized protein n=1 Tax=Notodromas monacha TaxID=399045 RepID=A0A7R9BJ87_9CRUS|nr:unnamed protein product [Notodromas monacha]CAG0916507.1 unnamed protein product [Notodromas monacha]